MRPVLNPTCPWSGNPVSPDSLTHYRDQIVGFCNPDCRDKFASAVAQFDAALPRSAQALWQLAGASRVVPKLADSVLIVIDAQEEYRTGHLPLDGIDAALAAIASLLNAARVAGVPVVHVVHRGKPGGLFDPASSGRILAQATPLPSEAIVEKTLPNAFANTDLAAILRDLGGRSPILAGFMTHNCIDATARAALDHGWPATLIVEALADRALPDPFGGPDVSAAELQRNVLAGLADRIAIVARLQEVL